MSDELSPEQIKNWRRILCSQIGPYALIMTDLQVQGMRDGYQRLADKKTDESTAAKPLRKTYPEC